MRIIARLIRAVFGNGYHRGGYVRSGLRSTADGRIYPAPCLGCDSLRASIEGGEIDRGICQVCRCVIVRLLPPNPGAEHFPLG